jgi:hypothetical protein
MPTPTPGGTPNPFAHFDTVILKDMKLKPTEQPDEAGDDTTPEATPVATETPVPEIKSVNIHDYIKGIMYAATGSANFKGDEYKNGYKAIGIAAYTLLLREIGGNSDFDVLVNGYTTSQKHFIAYKDYSQAPSDIKRAIDNAYDEIVVSVDVKENNIEYQKNYIKAFWFDSILYGKNDFIKERSIDGVKMPNVLTNIFSYCDGRNARNIIIQSGLNILGETRTYLRETMCDEADVAVPAGLKSGSKCGMSAWAAM